MLAHLFLFLSGGFCGIAHAKKAIILFNFNTQTIMQVGDLPDIAALQSKDGTYIDLGYKFNPPGADRVGCIGSDDK